MIIKAARLVGFCLIFAVTAPFTFAQNYPMPGSNLYPEVICTTCPSTDPLTFGQLIPIPTWSYGAPLTRHAGRYLDSQLTGDYQAGFGMRTLRAGLVKVVPGHNRVYMIIGGGTFASYDMNTFFTQKLGQPLADNDYIAGTWRDGRPREQHLRWDGHIYPEGPFSGWQTAIIDNQTFLYDFDTDDRNYVYLAYSGFGWGIVRNESNASLSLVSQQFDNGNLSPTQILSVRNGANYYAIASDAGAPTSLVYDVTNPAAPSLVRTLNFGITSAAKTPSHVALITQGKLRIYTISGLVNGSGPINEFSPVSGTFQMTDSDDIANFFAVENANNAPLRFSIFSPSGGTFTESRYSGGETFLALGLRHGSNHLSIWGYDTDFRADVRVFKLNNLTPGAIGLNRFFRNYYTGPPAGYAKPNNYTGRIYDVLIHNYGGRDYLFYANHGMGDVYELDGPDTPLPPQPTPTPGPTPSPTPTPTPGPTPPPGPTPTPGPSTCPQPKELQIIIQCVGGTCRPNEPIQFVPNDYFQPGRFAGTCADSFFWNFGDGGTSTDKSPQHTYGSAQNFTVQLTVNPQGGSQVSTSNVVNMVGGSNPIPTPTPTPTPTPNPNPNPTPTPTPPQSSCSVPPTDRQVYMTYSGPISGCSWGGTCAQGENITFSVERFDPSYTLGTCQSYTWSFNGQQKSDRTVQHSFNSGGPQNVSVTISVNGSSTTLDATVQIEGQPAAPVTGVSISAPSASSAGVGVPTVFVATATPDEQNVSFTWSFVDPTGEITPGSGKTVTKTFATAGKYQVTVTAARGVSSAQASREFTVSVPNTFAFLLPVVAHLTGEQGTQWRTDLQILNTDPNFKPAEPMVLEVTFKGQTKDLVVDSSTMIREDFMTFFTDGNDAGPMIVRGTSEHVPQMWTRTYVAPASGVGTYGQFIQAVRLDTVTSAASVEGPLFYYLAGLENSSDFRTNVGLVNPTDTPLQAKFIAFDDGVSVRGFTETVEPFSLKQITNMKDRIPQLKNVNKYSIEVESLSGRELVVYQSSIDMKSNDPGYVQGLSSLDTVSEGHKTQWVPGVARLINGNWKSDLTIFNPGGSGVQLELTFFDRAGNELGKGSHTLQAKQFLHFQDILRTSAMTDLPADGNLVGAIRIDTISPAVKNYPMIHGRTYSESVGTFGQTIPAFAGDRPNVKANQTGYIAGVRNNSSYRTNLGLIATEGPVTVEVTLLNPNSGISMGSWVGSLTEHGSLIENLFGSTAPGGAPGLINSDLGSGSLRIRILEGTSVWAFASMIDRKTLDPEYIRATSVDNE